LASYYNNWIYGILNILEIVGSKIKKFAITILIAIKNR
jgi:hypothetical protein